MRQLKVRDIILVVAVLITLVLLAPSQFRQSIVPVGYHNQEIATSTDLNITDVIRNATLGFEEITVISLPTRTDKRDAWTVMSALFNLQVHFADGVDGSTVSDKALPFTLEQKPSIIGCWRAHMNVLQDIINRQVNSALIMEDDADWDVSIRSQLVQFAEGARWLQETAANTSVAQSLDHPYGTDWDLLWLGNCASRADPWDNRRFVIENDPAADPLALRQYGIGPDNSHWEGSQTRLVFSQYYGVCTTAYAISQSGARKMLYHLGMQPFNSPLDLALSDLCKLKSSGFNCIGTWPPMIGVHRPAGKASGWSDVESGDADAVGDAHSERIVFSARLNIDRLLQGQDVFKASNPEWVGREEMSLADISVPVGYPQRVELSENEKVP